MQTFIGTLNKGIMIKKYSNIDTIWKFSVLSGILSSLRSEYVIVRWHEQEHPAKIPKC